MSANSRPAVWWVRRDFRLADNPALLAAIDAGSDVLPLFVLDPVLLRSAGHVRRAWLMAALHALDQDLRDGGGPGLSVVRGRPDEVLPRVATSCGAEQVHVSADFGPYGRQRDERVGKTLERAGLRLVATGSPYAVAPGTLRNQSRSPFQVFSPFHRAWIDQGVHDPAPLVHAASVDWIAAAERDDIEAPDADLVDIAGEKPALAAWHEFLDAEVDGASDYDKNHNLPGPDATSHLSVALRWGHIHPRTILAGLKTKQSKGALALARQIAWRDFHADVLYHRPDAVTEPIRSEFAKLPQEEPETDGETARRLKAWQDGRTGYPLVDAGMRQLLVEGWMHNRVRMLTASFLVKDLHIGWWHGAAWFMERLRDGDIAQNQLNWQWVAGCGMDAAPYYRIFNPSLQAEKFDRDGTYIRRYLPELESVNLKYLHEPWTDPAGPPKGYPAPIVDHAAERKESLERYSIIRR